MIRILRLVVGAVLWFLAAYWAVRWAGERILARLDRELEGPGRYPNEWGVRTWPLNEIETREAIALEEDLAAG